MATIECCMYNTDRSTRARIEDQTDLELLAKSCLHRCGDCQHEQFLVVDGEYQSAKTHDELLNQFHKVSQ